MRIVTFARSLLVLTMACTFAAGQAAAQRSDGVKLQQAARVLEIFSTDDDHGIPTEILQRARGIVVIPNLIRGGFLFGGRRGRGVMAVRAPNGEWSNPAFITLTGGSFGAQFGAETADVVLVFANDRAVRNISSGKFTLGGDAAAVAGPLGRRSTAAVTGRAEIYVYMHSKGLFAGAAFEGTRLDVDQDASAAFYGNGGAKPLDEQNYGTPSSALPFLEALRNAAVLAAPPGVTLPGSGPVPTAPNEEAVTFPIDQAPVQ
jgi:lipid-binding SYLF domain-containing protein